MLLAGCHYPAAAPPHPPVHPPWEMFARASSPPSSCPGQYRTTLEESSGTVFLICWGNKGSD
jgi:hypothetical protein